MTSSCLLSTCVLGCNVPSSLKSYTMTFPPYCFGTVFQHREAVSWAIVPSKILNKLDSKFLHYAFFFKVHTCNILLTSLLFFIFFCIYINRYIRTRSGQIQLGSICSFQIISKNLWATFWNTSISVWLLMSEVHWPLFSLSHLAESVGVSHCCPLHTACVLHCVQVFATPWTVAHQAPLSMGFPRQESWSGSPFPPPGDLPDPWIEPVSPVFPAVAGRFFTTEPPGKPHSGILNWV